MASAAGRSCCLHDDLHGANLYLHNGAARILDWGDSCISHPFLTLFVTFLHLEEPVGKPREDAWLAPLRDAYLEPWGRSAELREALEIAERVGAFAHLFKELRVFDAVPREQRSDVAPDLRSILSRCVAAAKEKPRLL